MGRRVQDSNFAAGILLVRSNGKLGVDEYLLGKRSETIDEGGLWGTPGGGADKGEDPLETALREFEEELGSLPEDLELEWTSNYEDEFMLYVCRTNDSDWRPDLEDASHGFETDNVAWFTLDELLSGEPRPEREEGHPSPWSLHFGVEAIFDRDTEIQQVEEGIKLEAMISEDEVYFVEETEEAYGIIKSGSDYLEWGYVEAIEAGKVLPHVIIDQNAIVVKIYYWQGSGKSAILVSELIERIPFNNFYILVYAVNKRLIAFLDILGASTKEPEWSWASGIFGLLKFVNKRPVPLKEREDEYRISSMLRQAVVLKDPIIHDIDPKGHGEMRSGPGAENHLMYRVMTSEEINNILELDFVEKGERVVSIVWWKGEGSSAGLVGELLESLPFKDFTLVSYSSNIRLLRMFRNLGAKFLASTKNEGGWNALKFRNGRPAPFAETER